RCDFEYGTEISRSSTIVGSIEAPISGLNQPRRRVGAIGTVLFRAEDVQGRHGTIPRHFEGGAGIVGSTSLVARRCPIEHSIASLHKNGLWSRAIGREFKAV